MKIKIKFLIIIIFCYTSLKSQNLISNPSFEAIGTPSFPFPALPWLPSMLAASDSWHSLAEVGETCDNSNLIRSTPDLFKVGTFTIHFGAITGNTGTTYAGMTGAEIIQQKLSQPLQPGRYRIKLFVRSAASSPGLVNSHLTPGCSFFFLRDISPTINIFVHDSKIEYDPSAKGPTTGMVSDMKKNNLQPVVSISTPTEAQTMWKEISAEFFIEQNGKQWIGIEGLFNPFSNASPYTLIDDIVLEKIPCNSCTDLCNPESGCISAGIAYTDACNLEVVKLGNASSLDISITSVNGATQYRNIHIEHPPCRVRFDGRNQAGIDLAAGLYRMTAKVKNGCDIIILVKDFLKTGAWVGVNSDCQLNPIDYNNLSTTSKINPLLVCCPENLNIGQNTQITDISTTPNGLIQCLGIGDYLGQQSFYNLPALNLKAKKEIVLEAGISNMRNITFTAPKIIIKGSNLQPQIIYPNSKFINGVNCPFGFQSEDENSNEYFLATSTNNNIVLKNKISESNLEDFVDNSRVMINISPNPNHGEFTINLSSIEDLSKFTVEISDFLGKKIVHNENITTIKHSIDLSKYPNGLYMIRINKNNTLFWISKVLKVK